MSTIHKTPLQRVIADVEDRLRSSKTRLPAWDPWDPAKAEIGHLAALDALMEPYGVSVRDMLEPRVAKSVRIERRRQENLERN